MWLPPVTVTPPAAEPILLAEAKEYLRIDDADTSFDDEVGRYIKASRSEIETWSSTRMITQTMTVAAMGFQALQALPIGPVQSISSIKYIDSDEAEQTWATENYELAGAGLDQFVRLKAGKVFPTAQWRRDAIRMTAVVGYGLAGEDLPSDVHFALLRSIRAKMDDKPFDLLEAMTNHRIWI